MLGLKLYKKFNAERKRAVKRVFEYKEDETEDKKSKAKNKMKIRKNA